MHLKQLCATLCVTHATSQSVLLTWLQQTCLDYETLEGEGKRFQQSRSSFISSWWTYMLPLWWHITTLHLSIWNECPLEFLPCEDLGFQCHLAFCPLGWRGWGVGVHINTPTYYHMWPSLSPCSTYMCQCIWALHSKSNQRKHIHTRKYTNMNVYKHINMNTPSVTCFTSAQPTCSSCSKQCRNVALFANS